jgi:hypothetical protein
MMSAEEPEMPTQPDPAKQQRQQAQKELVEIQRQIDEAPEGENTGALEAARAHKEAHLARLDADQAKADERQARRGMTGSDISPRTEKPGKPAAKPKR